MAEAALDHSEWDPRQAFLAARTAMRSKSLDPAISFATVCLTKGVDLRTPVLGGVFFLRLSFFGLKGDPKDTEF